MRKSRMYEVTVNFIKPYEQKIHIIHAANMEHAKIRMKLLLQKQGDEMFVRSIKVRSLNEKPKHHI